MREDDRGNLIGRLGFGRDPCGVKCPCVQDSHRRLGGAEQTSVYQQVPATNKIA